MSTQNSLIVPTSILISSAIKELVEHPSSKFYSLRRLFVKPQYSTVERFEEVVEKYSLDIEHELENATDKVINLIMEINCLWDNLPITFEELLDTSEVDTTYELLGAMGIVVRFWDNYNLEDFGLSTIPPLPHAESFYEEASSILEKVILAKRKNTFMKFSDMRKAS